MANRKRRKRGARNTAAATGPACLQASRQTKEPKQTRAPAGQHDLPPEGADAEDLEAVHTEAIERYETGLGQGPPKPAPTPTTTCAFSPRRRRNGTAPPCASARDEQRPILTVNKCPQFVRQVTGDIRQLRPSIHVVPVDERANEMVSL